MMVGCFRERRTSPHLLPKSNSILIITCASDRAPFPNDPIDLSWNAGKLPTMITKDIASTGFNVQKKGYS